MKTFQEVVEVVAVVEIYDSIIIFPRKVLPLSSVFWGEGGRFDGRLIFSHFFKKMIMKTFQEVVEVVEVVEIC